MVIFMEWNEKIKKGMELIGDGCSYTGINSKCIKCPFKLYCDLIYIEINAKYADLLMPWYWDKM